MEEAGGWDGDQGRRLGRFFQAPVLVRCQGPGWFQDLDLVTLGGTNVKFKAQQASTFKDSGKCPTHPNSPTQPSLIKMKF